MSRSCACNAIFDSSKECKNLYQYVTGYSLHFKFCHIFKSAVISLGAPC